MSTRPAVIRFEGIEAWEESRQQVDNILEQDTGTRDYPSTKSLPPIIIGVQVNDATVDKLKALDGVLVTYSDED